MEGTIACGDMEEPLLHVAQDFPDEVVTLETAGHWLPFIMGLLYRMDGPDADGVRNWDSRFVLVRINCHGAFSGHRRRSARVRVYSRSQRNS